jgi:hypothetical protein
MLRPFSNIPKKLDRSPLFYGGAELRIAANIAKLPDLLRKS